MRGKVVFAKRMYNVALGVIYNSRYQIQRQAILQHLGDELNETCGIAIPDGTEMTYYDRVESNWPIQVNLKTGSHVPLWCSSSGKLYLSFLPKICAIELSTIYHYHNFLVQLSLTHKHLKRHLSQ